LVQDALDMLLSRQRRRSLSEAEKEEVLRRQPNCAACGEPLDEDEFDHIVPLAQGGSQDLQNFQALHVSCHAEKSAAQRQPRGGVLASHFN
jgi:5-methylcytosine-specific restriction endonuclease McrA